MNRDYRVVQSKSGKGVFSNVVKAVNQLTNSEVAIKMLRSEEIYQRSGERERTILLKLNEQDKNSQMHIIRMLDSFEYRKHLCLVFESMDTNLREYIRSTGKGI
jgi:serine/threonine-protein kinase PRP4